ncbi:MAG TPA: hypothetical protein VEJ38_15290 [Candidatus Acidoferrales bacterium]|nr:hypothetical protein [Candidatus Acidoferrales bacterium]
MNREDPFSGRWKLNPEKSNLDPNHRPSSATMHWERTSEGYRMTAEGVKGDGNVVKERPATFILDGKDHAVPDSPGLCAAMSRPTLNAIEVVTKYAGSVVGNASYVVSGDEATLIASVSGIDAQQQPFETMAVFDRL